eukprot:3230500-Amphidinium_carterae.1
MSGFDPDRHAALLAAATTASLDAFPKLPWEEEWIAPLFGGDALPWEQSWNSTALSSVEVFLPERTASLVEESVTTCEQPPKRAKREKGFSGWSVSDSNNKNAELLCWVDIALVLGEASR